MAWSAASHLVSLYVDEHTLRGPSIWLQIVFRASIKVNQGDSFQSPQIVRAKTTNHSSKEQRLSSPTSLGKYCGRMTINLLFSSLYTMEWHSCRLIQLVWILSSFSAALSLVRALRNNENQYNTMVENLGFGDRWSNVWILVLHIPLPDLGQVT